MLRTSLNQCHRDQAVTGALSTSGQHFEKKTIILCLSQVTATWKDQLDILWPVSPAGLSEHRQSNLDYFMFAVD